MQSKEINQSAKSGLVLAFFLVCAFAASAGGYFFPPGDWYQSIQRPSFTPPSWVFGPVWTTLYVLMSVAAWRVWRIAGWRSPALRWWFIQVILNAAWTPLFFGLNWLGVALFEMALLWGAILLTLLASRRVDKLTTWLLAPYLAWVSFAWVLNAAFFWINR